MSSDTPRFTNRLARESSPYLQQHQHNPVDWYPWGEEAFAAARRLNRPIFLSVGYSTCYWCHVMERQSFEIEQVAAQMNSRFINIKVDREERPDVDSLYMLAVQILTRQGGWPMSVFLTPDGKPFYGGTYFPPTDQYGRPGFTTLLIALDDAWHNRHDEIDRSVEQLESTLRRLSLPRTSSAALTLDAARVGKIIDRSTGDYDPKFGGFGSAPKFPRETWLELLLLHQHSHPDEARMKMIRHTLDAMAEGGIRDHLGGGFHRYSTDARWLVPHFEIMLYDNAMLAWVYAEAYRQTEEVRYAHIARGICDFVLREMTSPTGAFYTAFDAEVDAREGLSYLWTPQQVIDVLGDEDARLFNNVYGLDRGPNFADPHHGNGTPDANILFLPEPLVAVAARMSISVDDLEARLAPLRQKLHAARLLRKQPLLDTKILTSWNALMVRGMVYAGRIVGEPRYITAAARAASFLLTAHGTQDNGLFRTSRDGVAKTRGFLDDYAFLIAAMLELNDAGAAEKWEDEARAMTVVMLDLFADSSGGGLFFTDKLAADLFIRQKSATDNPLPSGNAVAAATLLRLGHIAEARQILLAFLPGMTEMGEAMSSMLEAALAYVEQHGPITIKPASGAETTNAHDDEADESPITISADWLSPTELHLHLDIQPGYHLNAHDASAGLVATQVTVAGEGAAQVASIDYPSGEMRTFPFAGEALRVYDKRASIVIRFSTAPKAERLRLVVSYQACTDDACLAPVKVAVEFARG